MILFLIRISEKMETFFKSFQWNKYLPMKIILMAEVAWAVVFAAFVIWLQVSDGIGMDVLRDAIIKLAFHAGAPIAIIGVLEKQDLRLRYLPVFWIWFVVFTDLWSVLDLQLHVSTIVGIASTQYNAVSSLSIIAICLSGIVAVYYTALLLWQALGSQSKVVKELRKAMMMERDDSTEKLMSKIQHPIARYA